MTSNGDGAADRRAWPVAPDVTAPPLEQPTGEIPVLPAAPASPPAWGPGPVAPRRRRAWWLLVAGAVALVVLAAGGTAIWLVHGTGSRRAAAVPSPSGMVGERALAPEPSDAPSGSTAADPNLVADDEFSGTAPDPAKWGVYQSTADNGSSWLRGQVRVGNGELQIVGAGRNPTGKGDVAGGLCWCGPGGDRLYGVWEVRARFEAGAGYGPIVGLYPQGDRTADGSLTFASLPEADRHTLHGYVLWPTGPTARATTGDFTTWHTYRVEWRSTFVKMYVDGRLFSECHDSLACVTACGLVRASRR